MTDSPTMPTDADLLAALDQRYVWHPFTPMRQWLRDEPLVIAQGEGFELIDTRGRRYIDGFSSLWCNLHGHQVEAIDRAIADQLGQIAHSTLLGFASGPSIELAKRLVSVTPPGLEKVFYSDSGATAVEVALKMAFQYWRNQGQTSRRRFIALRGGYHGDTVGSVSVGGIDLYHNVFSPLLFETDLVDTPNPYRNEAGVQAGQVVLGQIEDILASRGEQVCAVVLEPLIQGAAGMLTHPCGFLAGVRELTRKYNVLMITDEVATGFCRTGSLFACEHESVSPDLMCMGKGLTGGYMPVAATLATQDIFDAFCGELAQGRTFYHGHTYTGNALGCAAAVASCDLIFSSGLLDVLPEKVEYLSRRLGEFKDHPHVGDVRQCGMMAGIELVADRDTGRAFEPGELTGANLCKAARLHGLIIRPLGDTVVLMPAPAMDLPTLSRMMDAVAETMHDYFQEA